MRVTLHAHHRFRQHHPTATPDDVAAAVYAGREVDPDLARSLIGRAPCRVHSSIYIASCDGRGMFVLTPEQAAVITYLRLSLGARFLLCGDVPKEAIEEAALPAPPQARPPITAGDIWTAKGGRLFLVEAAWPGHFRLQRIRIKKQGRLKVDDQCRARSIPWRFEGRPVGWPVDYTAAEARKLLLALHAKAQAGEGGNEGG